MRKVLCTLLNVKNAIKKTTVEYRRNNEDSGHGYCIKNLYGILKKEYEDMSEKQGHKCAICKLPEKSMRNGKIKRLAVDHDHVTGKIRGLLCGDCNIALGKLKDSIQSLENAIEYLRKSNA